MDVDAPSRKTLSPGDYCLLRVMHRHFWVRVIEIDEDGVRLSFPGSDYPIPGMEVEIELHEEEGYTSLPAEVIKGPAETTGGIVVHPLNEGRFQFHRGSVRVATDLTVMVRDTVHIRQYTADLLNLSGGGCLIRASAPFELGTTVEMTLSLPQESRQLILCRVVHHAEAPQDDHANLFGLKFTSVDPSAHRCIGRYVFTRIQAMYPKY